MLLPTAFPKLHLTRLVARHGIGSRIGKAGARDDGSYRHPRPESRLTGSHPVLAVPGHDGGRCKLPVSYRPSFGYKAVMSLDLKVAIALDVGSNDCSGRTFLSDRQD